MRKKRRNLWSFIASVAIAGVLALCLSRLKGDWDKYQTDIDIKESKEAALNGLEEKRDQLIQRAGDLENDSLEKQRLLRSHGYGRPGEQRYLLRTQSEAENNGASP